jgi:hypothetical protein
MSRKKASRSERLTSVSAGWIDIDTRRRATGYFDGDAVIKGSGCWTPNDDDADHVHAFNSGGRPHVPGPGDGESAVPHGDKLFGLSEGNRMKRETCRVWGTRVKDHAMSKSCGVAMGIFMILISGIIATTAFLLEKSLKNSLTSKPGFQS